jgi:hypothetical protein
LIYISERKVVKDVSEYVCSVYRKAEHDVPEWRSYGSLDTLLMQLPASLSVPETLMRPPLKSISVELSDFVALPSMTQVGVAGGIFSITAGFVGYQKVLRGALHAGRLVGISTAKQWLIISGIALGILSLYTFLHQA